MVGVVPFLGFIAAFVGVFYQFVAQPILHNKLGVGRTIHKIRDQSCQKLTQFEACEQGWYHQPSGLLYLACSTLKGRHKWLPNADIFDLDNRPETDYLAIYNTHTGEKTVINPQGFPGTNGKGSYNLHGMGVHMTDEEKLRIFLINHRPQPNPHQNGANSTVELFETTLGDSSMQHIKTFAHQVIFTPNDLTPTGPDSFIFSNDHSVKVGHNSKMIDLFRPRSSVARCDNKGCRKIIDPYQYPNGIAGGTGSPNPNPNLVYIASSAQNILTVVETQADGSVVKLDEVPVEYPLDNISVDSEGNILAAGFPALLKMADSFKDPENSFPPTALLKISKNKGQDAFYGQKWKTEILLQDDGSTVSGFTFVEHDTERQLLFAGGVFTPYLAICKL